MLEPLIVIVWGVSSFGMWKLVKDEPGMGGKTKGAMVGFAPFIWVFIVVTAMIDYFSGTWAK